MTIGAIFIRNIALLSSANQVLKRKNNAMKLDNIDRMLLELLQTDAKINVKELSAALGLTKTPIYDRIKRLESEGIIDRYVALLDQRKLPTYMVVFCSVSLESQKLEALESFSTRVLAFPEVMECYLMGGDKDFLLKLIVKDLNDYHRFSSGKLAALPNIAKIKSSFVLNEIKSTAILPIYTD